MNKRIVLVATAVLLALMGTLAVYSYGRSADQRAIDETKGTKVLVVVKRIAAGTTWADTVKGSYVKQESFPAKNVPTTALASTTNAVIGNDAVAQTDIAPGQLVLRESYGTKTAQTGALTIPKGLIAVSFQFGGDSSVAGYVGPGAEVVVFLTDKLDDGHKTATPGTQGDDLEVTKTLVPRADVIATSTSVTSKTTGSSANDGGPADASGATITLALDQRDAERVILGQKIGELYLGLLSPSSVVSADDPGQLNVAQLKPAQIFVK